MIKPPAQPASVSCRPNRREFVKRSGRSAAGALLGSAAVIGCQFQSDPSIEDASSSSPRAKRVGISLQIGVEILYEFVNDMKVEAEKPENKIHLVTVNADGDSIKQYSDIEGFIAQRYDGIFIFATEPDGLIEMVADARRNGIVMMNHSATPVTGCTQNVVLQQYETGYQLGQHAAEWVHKNFSGQVEVGVLSNRTDRFLQRRTDGVIAGLKETAPDAKIVGEVEAHTVQLGTDGAANLLQAHPAIKMLLSFSDDAGFGAYTAATEAGHTDPDKFYVGSLDGTQLVCEKITEGGIYHATWSYLFPYSATQWMRDMITCLRGKTVPPSRVVTGRLVHQENIEQFEKMIRNPQAPENQHLYDDPTVMHYLDEALETPLA